MMRLFTIVLMILVAAVAGISWAADQKTKGPDSEAKSDSSVDKYIKDLKDSNPDVRAKAAYELGCG